MLKFISEVEGLEEAAQDAYLNGNIQLYNLLVKCLEHEEEQANMIEDLEDREELTPLLKEKLNYLMEFFEDCFNRLDGHYPCASYSSDYDKSIIYSAITLGEEYRHKLEEQANKGKE